MDTLTRMRAFIDVVDAEGYSAAARKMGRSKALLSKYVKELEDELGALLLNRTTRQFSLTEAGHTYYRTASDILKEIDNLADLVREGATDLKGRIKVSVPRSFVDADIGRSLIDFSIEHPDITLEIIAEDRFVDLIEEGFDAAIRITKLEDSGMIARKLCDFGQFCFVSPAVLEKYGPINTPADLANVPCIVDTNSRYYNNWRFETAEGLSQAVTVSGPIEVNSPIASTRAAIAGLGVAMIPDFVAKPKTECGELITILDEFIPKGGGIYAIYPHRRYLPAKVRRFVDFLYGWFKKNGAGNSVAARID
ncbi:LysR family transcriptional regulator [Rhizobium sp. LjRoot254]|uniref:LysR family transcriptional regulator n=1 Tax=Rhizobium sp. LjRoot254 TaxID=3342297 RepID=UPI003ECF3181